MIRKRPKQKYKKEYDDYEETGEPLWEDSSYPEEDYDYVGDDTKVEVGRFMIILVVNPDLDKIMAVKINLCSKDYLES